MSSAPQTGGEPLWHVVGEPAIFVCALHLATECRSGRLPRISQRDAFTHGFRFVYLRAIELRTGGSFAGAACFTHVSAGLVMRLRLRGWPDTCQSGTPPGIGRCSSLLLFAFFAAIPSYPLRLILRTMGSFILIFFALLAAARGIADSPTPSGSLASLPDGLYAKITTPRGIIMGKRVQQ